MAHTCRCQGLEGLRYLAFIYPFPVIRKSDGFGETLGVISKRDSEISSGWLLKDLLRDLRVISKRAFGGRGKISTDAGLKYTVFTKE